VAQYSQTELEVAGRQLATAISTLHSEIQELKGRPAVERFQQDVRDGHEMAKRAGYSDADIARLEERMTSENVGNYAIALRSGLVEPSGPFLLNRLGADEFKKLMDGDDAGFLNLAVGRGLDEARGR
jgi:hypothetical protein